MKKEFICVLESVQSQDSNMSIIHELIPQSGDPNAGVWIKLISWDESRGHKELSSMSLERGKKYKLTIEEVE